MSNTSESVESLLNNLRSFFTKSMRSSEVESLMSLVKGYFVEHKLPDEALRDPQVAIAVMQFKTTGLELAKHGLQVLSRSIEILGDLELLKSKLSIKREEHKTVLETTQSTGETHVNVGGMMFPISVLVKRLNEEVPQPILRALLNTEALNSMKQNGNPGSQSKNPTAESTSNDPRQVSDIMTEFDGSDLDQISLDERGLDEFMNSEDDEDFDSEGQPID